MMRTGSRNVVAGVVENAKMGSPAYQECCGKAEDASSTAHSMPYDASDKKKSDLHLSASKAHAKAAEMAPTDDLKSMHGAMSQHHASKARSYMDKDLTSSGPGIMGSRY